MLKTKSMVITFLATIAIITFILLLMSGVAIIYATGILPPDTLATCCYIGIPIVVLLVFFIAYFFVRPRRSNPRS
jgi:uncharacterized BrkB/YihY/UPF0761 family membrane protein